MARKGRGGDGDVRFVNLHGRPRTPLEAAETARAIRNMPADDRHGLLHVGGRVGNFIRAALCESGCVGVREPFVAATSMSLGGGRLALRRLRGDLRLPTARLGTLGSRGAYHLDIAGGHGGVNPRGPFEMVPLAPGCAAAYPALWRHDAGRETRLVVEPDSEGRPRAGCDDRAEDLWESTASRLHFSLDFQLNSQPLAACLTPGPAIGGRAWPNFRLSEPDWEQAVLLWSNTTLGLLCSWWHGTRQQQGRVIMTITTLPDLPVIDPRELTADQLRRAGGIFEAFRDRTLLPANEAWRDETGRRWTGRSSSIASTFRTRCSIPSTSSADSGAPSRACTAGRRRAPIRRRIPVRTRRRGGQRAGVGDLPVRAGDAVSGRKGGIAERGGGAFGCLAAAINDMVQAAQACNGAGRAAE